MVPTDLLEAWLSQAFNLKKTQYLWSAMKLGIVTFSQPNTGPWGPARKVMETSHHLPLRAWPRLGWPGRGFPGPRAGSPNSLPLDGSPYITWNRPAGPSSASETRRSSGGSGSYSSRSASAAWRLRDRGRAEEGAALGGSPSHPPDGHPSEKSYF